MEASLPLSQCQLRHWIHLGPEYADGDKLISSSKKNTLPRKHKVKYLNDFDKDKFPSSSLAPAWWLGGSKIGWKLDWVKAGSALSHQN